MEEVTWDEALRDFLRGCEGTLERNTVDYYRHQLHQLVSWVDERDVPLQAFKARHMREYLACRAEQGLSQKSRRHDAICAKVFLKHCRREEYISADPLRDYQIPRAPEPYVLLPTAENLRDLLQSVLDYWSPASNPKIRFFPNQKDERRYIRERDYAILVGLIDSGARIGEILNLDMADYRPRDLEIHIKQSKGDKPRQVPVSQGFINAVQGYLAMRPLDGCERLFLNQFGEPVDYSHFGKAFRHYRDFADLPKFTLHAIRHYTGTQLARHGVKAAQLILGHKRLETTNRYTHAELDWAKELHRDVNVLGAVLVNVRSQKQAREKKLGKRNPKNPVDKPVHF